MRMIERIEEVIPEKRIVQWKVTHPLARWRRNLWDTEEEARAHLLRCEKYERQVDAFKGVRADSRGCWPQNITARGTGFEKVFATTDSVRDWIVNNESLVMNFLNSVGNKVNE